MKWAVRMRMDGAEFGLGGVGVLANTEGALAGTWLLLEHLRMDGAAFG